MEPKVPQGESYTPPTPERGAVPVPLERGYDIPERPLQAPIERVGERQSTAAPAAAPVPIAAPSLPTPITPQADDAGTSTSDDNPAAAADEDLIEKEWVDRAKKIIAETKEDPHRREVEVNKLQADYLKKRYGKDLGQST